MNAPLLLDAPPAEWLILAKAGLVAVNPPDGTIAMPLLVPDFYGGS